jgi:hypothetical protein
MDPPRVRITSGGPHNKNHHMDRCSLNPRLAACPPEHISPEVPASILCQDKAPLLVWIIEMADRKQVLLVLKDVIAFQTDHCSGYPSSQPIPIAGGQQRRESNESTYGFARSPMADDLRQREFEMTF